LRARSDGQRPFAPKKVAAELVLEIADGAAQRRLRDVTLLAAWVKFSVFATAGNSGSDAFPCWSLPEAVRRWILIRRNDGNSASGTDRRKSIAPHCVNGCPPRSDEPWRPSGRQGPCARAHSDRRLLDVVAFACVRRAPRRTPRVRQALLAVKSVEQKTYACFMRSYDASIWRVTRAEGRQMKLLVAPRGRRRFGAQLLVRLGVTFATARRFRLEWRLRPRRGVELKRAGIGSAAGRLRRRRHGDRAPPDDKSRRQARQIAIWRATSRTTSRPTGAARRRRPRFQARSGEQRDLRAARQGRGACASQPD